MDANKQSIYQEIYPEKFRNYLLLSVICLGIAGFIEGPMHFLNFNKNDHIEEWLPPHVNDFFSYDPVVYFTLKFAGPVCLCIATGVGIHMWFQAVRHNYKVKWLRWLIGFFCLVGFISTFPVSTLSFEITTLVGSILTFHASKFIPSVSEARRKIAMVKMPAKGPVLSPALTFSAAKANSQNSQPQTSAQQKAESYKKIDSL